MKQNISSESKSETIKRFNDIFERIKNENNGYLSKNEFELHTNKLKELDSLEEQIDYMNEALPNYSILKPLKFENQIYHLAFTPFDKRFADLILTKEIERLINHKIKKFESTSILNDFYARAATEKHDFKYLKKQSLIAIKNFIGSGSFVSDMHWRYLKQGFKAYKGGDSIKDMKKDLAFIFGRPVLMENFTSLFEGYRLAKVTREIKAFDETKEKSQINRIIENNRIEVKVSMPVFAAIIYKFGTSGEMFPIMYKENREYNASATAEYYYKRFKVLKSNGQEVSLTQFRKCFKESEMENIDSTVLNALDKFPFNKME